MNAPLATEGVARIIDEVVTGDDIGGIIREQQCSMSTWQPC